jgi:hypothetical protein
MLSATGARADVEQQKVRKCASYLVFIAERFDGGTILTHELACDVLS